jgi:hypothetical protein
MFQSTLPRGERPLIGNSLIHKYYFKYPRLSPKNHEQPYSVVKEPFG